MEVRNYEFYIERAKANQGFKYDNQLEEALGFKSSMIAIIKKGKKHLSEEKMIELAKLANIDPWVALIDLNILKSSGEVRSQYEDIMSKLGTTIQTLLFAVILGLSVSLILIIII
jgi:transcriptional regulator with XRE-family HTH domain